MKPAIAAAAVACALLCSLAAAQSPVPAPAPSPAVPPALSAQPRFWMSGNPVQGGLMHGTVPAGTVRLTLDGKPIPFDSFGRFLVGFDRDAGGAAALVAELSGGSSIAQPLMIAPRAWAIEHIDALSRPTAPDPAYLKLREGELARIAAARAQDSATDGWRQHFILPAKGRLSGLFGAQRIYRGVPAAFHSGLDIAAGAGATVVAPADGVVVLAGPPMFSLEGNLVIIDHGMGLNSAFLHLASYSVHVGQAVKQGEPVGIVGATGRATGPHLHWSIKWRDARLDPLLLVEAD